MAPTASPSLPMTKRWLLASRPKTLPAAISPVLVGWAVSLSVHHARTGSLAGFPLLPALVTLLIAILIQIVANLVNDVADYEKGADDDERLGPLRVTQAGLITSRQMWSAVLLLLTIAAVAGLYLVFFAGWPVLLIGAACMAGAVFYSVGRYSFSATGLGDLFATLFFGFGAVCGTVFVLTKTAPLLAWAAALPVGLLVTAILVVNNIRDEKSDRKAGRQNIPVRFGRKAGEMEYTLLLAAAYLLSFGVAAVAKSGWGLLVWLSLPAALKLRRSLIAEPVGPRFNLFLAQTARITLIYSLLLCAGILLNIWF